MAAARAETATRTEEFKLAIVELAAAEERAKALPGLTDEVARIRGEREAAMTRLATLEAEAAAHERRMTDLTTQHER